MLLGSTRPQKNSIASRCELTTMPVSANVIKTFGRLLPLSLITHHVPDIVVSHPFTQKCNFKPVQDAAAGKMIKGMLEKNELKDM